MNNFRSDNRSREKRSSFGRNSGGRDSGRREMFDAVCDNCGKNCQVPFKPSGDKPIYCSACFEEKGGREGGRQESRSSYGRDTQNRSSVAQPRNNVNDQAVVQLTKSIDTLSFKLDSIITLLSVSKKEEAPAAVKEEKKETLKAIAPKAKPVKKEKAVKTKASKTKLLATA